MKGKNNPEDYLFRHALQSDETPKEWKQESEELEKTISSERFSP